MTSDPIIRLQSVTKRFGAIQVLDDVSLEVAAGAVVCIIGPSGGGKSTLLRVINGIEPVQSGCILVDGIDVTSGGRSLHQVRGRVGMVFQSFNLFPHMTVRRNIALAPRRRGLMSRTQAEARAAELLARVRIPDKIDAYPSSLSGGEQQRVAIARALAMEPRVMLFDEPTSALDPEMVGEVLAVMRELAGTGITLLIVSHEIGFARSVADRMIFFEGGRIVLDAPPERFFSPGHAPRVDAFLAKVLS
jgi:ABC-type polar amino acid transport system ATPase subunit